MSQVKSHAHIQCVINGHRFEGWSEDDPPYNFETEDSLEIKMGQDGGLYGNSKPNFGGKFTFMVQPNSPTAQWAMQQEQLRKNAMFNGTAIRVYEGTFSDPVQGVSWRLQGGLILKFPPVVIANQNYEASIQFEVITASVDGGTFHPALASDIAVG